MKIRKPNECHFWQTFKTKLGLTMALALMLCSFGAFAQNKTIRGEVCDENREPIVGATIMVPNTSIGEVTDTSGKFTLSVPENTPAIQVSFIGYKTQEVAVKFNRPIFIILKEDVSEIDEVQVTALGVKKMTKKLGYSASELKGEELDRQKVVNPVEALQGQVAGLSVGLSDGGTFGSARIQLRGSSILGSGDNQPIFVIDGFITSVGVSGYDDWGYANANDWGSILKNLDMSTIESITVLKGAAATALYGSRGINGAIVIKTKGCESSGKGIGVTIRQTAGIDHAYDSMDFQYEFGPGYLPGVSQGSEGNRWNALDPKRTADGYIDIASYNGNNWTWGAPFNGEDALWYDEEIRPYRPVKDHHLKAFETGTLFETNATISGGNEKTRFFFSGTYSDRNGIYLGNDIDKNSFKMSGMHNFNDKFMIKAEYTATKTTPKNPNNGIGHSYHYGNFNNCYDAKTWGRPEIAIAPHGGLPSSDHGDKYARVPGNSWWFDYYTTSREREENLTYTKYTARFSPFDWLSFTGEYMRKNHQVKYEEKKTDSGYANSGGGGKYRISMSDNVTEIWKGSINFNKNISDEFGINGFLGAERWDSNNTNISSETYGGLIIPGKYYLNNSKKTIQTKGGFGRGKRINSLYGLLALEYKNGLFLEVTGRNDWSSGLTYSEGPSNNSYFYPSISTSTLVDEFIEMPAWIDMLKVRASWAQVGNDTGSYWLNPGYSTGSKKYDGTDKYFTKLYTEKVDPNIKPQMKTSWEYGIDFRFFKNRLGIDLAFYDDVIKNQIGVVDLIGESGYSKLKTNIATLTNKGVELSLSVTPIRTKDFEWESTFNYWHNENGLDYIHPFFGDYYHLGGTFDTYSHYHTKVRAAVGGTYGEVVTNQLPKTYINEDDPNDPNNGKKLLTYWGKYRVAYPIASGKTEVVGKSTPDFEGSLNTRLRWKNLSLSFLLDCRWGGIVASHEARYGGVRGVTKSSLRGRTPEHGGVTFTSGYSDDYGVQYGDGIVYDDSYVFEPDTEIVGFDGETKHNVGGMTMQQAIDAGYINPNHAGFHHYVYYWDVYGDHWAKDCKYISLRNINLTYKLPLRITKIIGSSSAFVGLNIRNAGYLYNNLPDNVNPESIRGNNASSLYTQSNSPYVRSYSFSLTVKF